MLREMAGGDFAAIDEAKAETTAMALLRREGPEITALGRRSAAMTTTATSA